MFGAYKVRNKILTRTNNFQKLADCVLSHTRFSFFRRNLLYYLTPALVYEKYVRRAAPPVTPPARNQANKIPSRPLISLISHGRGEPRFLVAPVRETPLVAVMSLPKKEHDNFSGSVRQNTKTDSPHTI